MGIAFKTRGTFFQSLFLLLLLADILIVYFGSDTLRYISKSLLMPVLILLFLSQTNSIPSGFKKWIVLALLFSWGGDVLLMFEPFNGIYFILGLSSFLVAHIWYIVFFHQVRMAEKIPAKPIFLVIVFLYYIALLAILLPMLGDLKIPVIIYGMVLCFMAMLSMHLYYIRYRQAAYFLLAGGLFFLVSDSVLAINKFYWPFQAADMVIMITYGLAQLFLVKGAIGYIEKAGR